MIGAEEKAKSENETFDWGLLMRFGLGAMGLGPEDFWRMTPGEFDAAAKGRIGRSHDGEAMTRSRFDALSARFPDKEGET